MAITRIKFNDSASPVGAYSLSLNPSNLELNDGSSESILDTLDGASVTQESFFDSRPYILTWSRVPLELPGFFSQLSTLRGYKNQLKYVNFETADYRVTGTGWSYVRVGNLETKIVSGGKIRYDVTLTLFPTVI